MTPKHFLTGVTAGLPPDNKISSNNRKKLGNNFNTIMNEFWTRILKEYLPTLTERRKWHSTVGWIELGGMEWILEDNTPRKIWPLGKLKKLKS